MKFYTYVQTIREWIVKRKAVTYSVGAAFFSVIFFLQLHASPIFLDADPFYHAYISQKMIEERGVVKEFPFLPLTTLKDTYTDHHLLYHLYLIPFILAIDDPLVATRIATIILSGVFIGLFCWFLIRYRIHYPLLYTFFLFTSTLFIFRINMDRAPAASLILLFLALHAILQKKRIMLMIISFLYVWLYAAWPIILIIAALWCVSDGLFKTVHHSRMIVRNVLKAFCTRENVLICASVVVGVSMGVIINPYFPKNLSFYWTQIVSIGLVTKGVSFGIGSEWLPMNLSTFLKTDYAVMALFLPAIAWMLLHIFHKNNKSQSSRIFLKTSPLSRETFFFWALSLLLFLYMLKSQRIVEYFIPIAVLTSAWTLQNGVRNIQWKEYGKIFSQLYTPETLIPTAILTVGTVSFFIAGWVSLGSTYVGIKASLQEGYRFDSFKNTSEYLRDTVPPGQIIFHDNWSYMPILLYYNNKHSYIAGLDPTFFHDKNPELFSVWFDSTNGKDVPDLAKTIKERFGARYIVAEKREGTDNMVFAKTLLHNKDFKKVHEDTDAYVFHVAD
ncbi:MAG: hypothetical protein Q7R79_04790 [bacterium]|nr:hypothetical protein [bacterium]